MLAWNVVGSGQRPLARWDGRGSLYQARNLRPTGALDGLIAGAAVETFARGPERVGRGLLEQAIRLRDLFCKSTGRCRAACSLPQ